MEKCPIEIMDVGRSNMAMCTEFYTDLLQALWNPKVQCALSFWAFQHYFFVLIIFHYPTGSFNLVHYFNMAYPSQSSCFNICDTIWCSIKMIWFFIMP